MVDFKIESTHLLILLVVALRLLLLLLGRLLLVVVVRLSRGRGLAIALAVSRVLIVVAIVVLVVVVALIVSMAVVLAVALWGEPANIKHGRTMMMIINYISFNLYGKIKMKDLVVSSLAVRSRPVIASSRLLVTAISTA